MIFRQGLWAVVCSRGGSLIVSVTTLALTVEMGCIDRMYLNVYVPQL